MPCCRYPVLRPLLPTLLVLTVLGAAGCDKPQPLGDVNALIVGVPDADWPALRDDVEAALEPRAFTVRDERIFRVTQVDPTGPYWGDVRRFRQVLLIGEPGDEWIAQALAEARHQPAQLPAVVEAENVWARGQRVLAMVVPPGSSTAAVRPLLPAVGETILRDYQDFIRQRMFASGIDRERVATLRQEAGFELVTPTVYRLERPDAGTYLFINDQPDPAQLQRVVLVAERSPTAAAPDAATLLDWREQAARQYYQPPQLTNRERIESREIATEGGARGVEVQGAWSSPPGEWPAGGPFLARALTCPDGRAFLLDAWVYAPGRDKYEYVLQLSTILDSFACGAQSGG